MLLVWSSADGGYLRGRYVIGGTTLMNTWDSGTFLPLLSCNNNEVSIFISPCALTMMLCHHMVQSHSSQKQRRKPLLPWCKINPASFSVVSLGHFVTMTQSLPTHPMCRGVAQGRSRKNPPLFVSQTLMILTPRKPMWNKIRHHLSVVSKTCLIFSKFY